MSRAIVAAIVARLEAILESGGFNTDAGLSVHAGRQEFDFSDGADLAPAINVVWDDEATEQLTYNSYRNVLTLAIDGYVIDNDSATLSTLDLKAAIHQALELTDQTLGGLAHGVDYAGAEKPEAFEGGLGASIRLFYAITYDRDYGA